MPIFPLPLATGALQLYPPNPALSTLQPLSEKQPVKDKIRKDGPCCSLHIRERIPWGVFKTSCSPVISSSSAASSWGAFHTVRYSHFFPCAFYLWEKSNAPQESKPGLF